MTYWPIDDRWTNGPTKAGELETLMAARGCAALDDRRAGQGSGVDEVCSDGSETSLVSELADFIGSFVAFPCPEARDAVALWVAHCHAIEAAAATPRLIISSPEKQSGKTRLLEVLELVVPRPIAAVNVSVSALYRSIGEPPPTILWDEVDTVFTRERDGEREYLRGVLNGGYRRGAAVLRVVIDGHTPEVKSFPSFAPVALAGIGKFPDTITDRGIVVELRRRLPNERVRPFRRRLVEPEAAEIRQRLAAWTAEHVTDLESARPSMPDGLSDRACDIWELLLAIADAVGGAWPERARRAAVYLAQVGREADGSTGVKLLADIRQVFSSRGDPDHLSTASLVEALVGPEESPWGDLHGRPLDARGLALRLRAFGVRSRQVRLGASTGKGYRRADLVEPWARYCPSASYRSETCGTGETAISAAALSGETSARTGTDLDEALLLRPTRNVSDRAGREEVEVSDVSSVSLPARGCEEEPLEQPEVGLSDPELWASFMAEADQA